MKTVKFYELPNFTEHFPTYFLEFDGDKGDKRLHFGHESVFYYNEQEYIEWEKKMDAFEIVRDGLYNIYISYDASGYGYWHDSQFEPNHMIGCITFDVNELTMEQVSMLAEDVSEAYYLMESVADNSDIYEYYNSEELAQ